MPSYGSRGAGRPPPARLLSRIDAAWQWVRPPRLSSPSTAASGKPHAGGDADGPVRCRRGHGGKATDGPRDAPSTAGRKLVLPPVERHEDEVDQLTEAVHESPQRAARGAVLELQGHLDDAEARAGGVHRHPDLHAETWRERHHHGED